LKKEIIKMHNIKRIRNDIEFFTKSLKKRFVDLDIKKIISLDENNRKFINQKEKLEKEKKDISKSKDKSLFEKSKNISIEIEKIGKLQNDTKIKLDNILSSIPNIPCDDVPLGKNEDSNIEISKSGIVPKFSFKPKSHFELGENLNMLDFDLASKTTGSRFVFVKDKLALLERALSNFMLDTHVNINGYQEISPPLIATDVSMYGTGQLPKFENDQFELKLDDSSDRKFLIPTAEVILTNIVRDKIIDKKDFPMRFVASTPCFRKEAGSYGKDTKGMIRQHQFYKVEMVSIVEIDKCISELDRMTDCATKILDLLKLPYRKIILCTGDMGFSAEKTFDIEVWLPSENKYREISSCSSCGSFQSRRMKTRYKNENNETIFPGTLNGSGLAVGRTLVAILENYQQSDGSIILPEVLRSYMSNIEKITKN
jgi:seryl-tRNA synthetase